MSKFKNRVKKLENLSGGGKCTCPPRPEWDDDDSVDEIYRKFQDLIRITNDPCRACYQEQYSEKAWKKRERYRKELSKLSPDELEQRYREIIGHG